MEQNNSPSKENLYVFKYVFSPFYSSLVQVLPSMQIEMNVNKSLLADTYFHS